MKVNVIRGVFTGFMFALLTCGGSFAQTGVTALPPIDPDRGGVQLPGKFVWADLVTDDLAVAKRFYQGLFGWTFVGDDGYLIASRKGRAVAGMLFRERPAGRPEARPRWMPYMSVADVDSALRSVTAGGGRMLAAPRDLPGRGRQAAVADPEGAVFGLVRSATGDPAEALPATGEWIWVQLISHDARRATGFYRQVGGYEVIANPGATLASDFLLSSNGYARATVRTIPRGRGDVRPVWLPFVRVDDVSRAQARAEALGGRVLIPARADLMDGQIAVVSDPAGAAVGIMEWKP